MVHDDPTWTAARLRAALAGGACYAGQLADLTHEEFVDLVERNGGRYVRYSNHGRFGVIVVGGAGLPVLPNGEPMALPAGRLISEAEFARLLDVTGADDHDRLYTAPMLSQLMGIPEARILAWVKAGLIRPVPTPGATPGGDAAMRFEFRQAAIARTLSELTAAGVTVDRLRRTLRQLQQQMPDLREPLQQLTILEHNGPLLVRLETGDLAEVTGQLQLEFDGRPQPEPLQLRLVPTLTTAADWHDHAVAHERAGRLAEAEAAYRQALLVGGPSPQAAFDLASILAKLGRTPQAIERYRQVVEIEPHHADAWNNLGILLADSGDPAGALEAFRQAIHHAPDDPRVHYNLADVLDTLGHTAEARAHWQEYLRHDPAGSPWSSHARERLYVPTRLPP